MSALMRAYVHVRDFGLARAFGTPVRFYSAEVKCLFWWVSWCLHNFITIFFLVDDHSLIMTSVSVFWLREGKVALGYVAEKYTAEPPKPVRKHSTTHTRQVKANLLVKSLQT